MSDTLSAITHELRRRGGSLTVDGLGVSAAGCVGRVLGGGEPKDVGPLLELLLV